MNQAMKSKDAALNTIVKDNLYSRIAGIDEVGRGPLAGPVVACAIVIPDNLVSDLIKDSKLLSPAARIKAYDFLIQQSISYGIGIVDHQTIDKINIRNATRQAMEQALSMLNHTVDIVLIDGNMEIHTGLPQKTIIDGDKLHLSIAAASVVAKIYRDGIMEIYANQYPEYGFEKHKGYGTKEHMAALEKYGPCPLHRKTFLRKFFNKQSKLPMGM